MRIRLLLIPLLSFLFAACAVPAYRANPTLSQRAPSLKTVLLISPKVEVFELGVGGITEKMDEWSEQGKKNVMAAVENIFSRRGSVGIKSFAEDALTEDRKTRLEETTALFNAVNIEILLHTYGLAAERFADKITAFDYSLGTEVQELSAGEGDALLFVRATDYVSSAGRIAAQMATMIIAAAFRVYVIPQGGNTSLSIALIDGKNGAILWHKFMGGPGFDLRDAGSAARLVEATLKDFPLP